MCGITPKTSYAYVTASEVCQTNQKLDVLFHTWGLHLWSNTWPDSVM